MGSKAGLFAKITFCAAALAALPGAQGHRTDFEERLLASHNRERDMYNIPELRWDAKLAEKARGWARELAATGKFEHSRNVPGQPFEGENIWGGRHGFFGPETMVDLWISEKRYFKPGTFPNNSTTGRVEDVSHFTQVVWRDTARVGCGLVRGQRRDVLVCRYSNPGNIYGRQVLRSFK